MMKVDRLSRALRDGVFAVSWSAGVWVVISVNTSALEFEHVYNSCIFLTPLKENPKTWCFEKVRVLRQKLKRFRLCWRISNANCFRIRSLVPFREFVQVITLISDKHRRGESRS